MERLSSEDMGTSMVYVKNRKKPVSWSGSIVGKDYETILDAMQYRERERIGNTPVIEPIKPYNKVMNDMAIALASLIVQKLNSKENS